MIRLTNAANGKLVYISPEQLTNIEPADDVTKLELVRGVHFVTESPSEVARKVLEYRLAMERYKAAYGIDIITPNETPESYKDEGYLRRLAGLEEQKDE